MSYWTTATTVFGFGVAPARPSSSSLASLNEIAFRLLMVRDPVVGWRLPVPCVTWRAFPDLSSHCDTAPPDAVIVAVSDASSHCQHPLIDVGVNGAGGGTRTQGWRTARRVTGTVRPAAGNR